MEMGSRGRSIRLLSMQLLVTMMIVVMVEGNTSLVELNCDTFCKAPCNPKVKLISMFACLTICDKKYIP